MRFATRAIHKGSEVDSTGSVVSPIYAVSTFKQPGIGSDQRFKYSRASNPTRSSFEECLASLEGAKYGLAFASGVAAEMAALSLLKTGDEVVTTAHMYGGTYKILRKIMVNYNISTKYVYSTDADDFERAITKKTKLIWLETPTNPILKILDIRAISDIAKKRKIQVVVDNTFASPYFQQPLSLGADIVVHSTTKYIGGHSDIIGGAVVTNNNNLYKKIKFYQSAAGAIASPFDSFLALRGLKTLEVRMKKHEENAFEVAKFLQNNKNVNETLYPGLTSHTGHEIAKKQMSGFGGMVSFRMKGNESKVKKFISSLKLFAFAESLGGIESLASTPYYMITHASLSEQERAKIGITRDLIRLSIGIEDSRDILEDLEQALG
jgi:cystathionine gamma-synthase/cystathionine gamma-lyase